jgi:hypothetical protein
MNAPDSTPFRIVEIDDQGWAAFKALEARQRREYAASPEAVADHEAWVNAPMADDSSWGSIPAKEKSELNWPEMISHPSQPALDHLKDFCRST